MKNAQNLMVRTDDFSNATWTKQALKSQEEQERQALAKELKAIEIADKLLQILIRKHPEADLDVLEWAVDQMPIVHLAESWASKDMEDPGAYTESVLVHEAESKIQQRLTTLIELQLAGDILRIKRINEEIERLADNPDPPAATFFNMHGTVSGRLSSEAHDLQIATEDEIALLELGQAVRDAIKENDQD